MGALGVTGTIINGPPGRALVNACEWNPLMSRPAYIHEGAHARATVCVGAEDAWHLCASCAELPKFKRYTVRRPIQRGPMP